MRMPAIVDVFSNISRVATVVKNKKLKLKEIKFDNCNYLQKRKLKRRHGKGKTSTLGTYILLSVHELGRNFECL